MSLEHLWAGWRRDYIVDATARARAGDAEQDESSCVFCRLAASGPPSEDNLVVWRGALTFVVMNAYPYASGHVLVLPLRHVGPLAELTDAESAELWSATQQAVAAIESAYEPDGLNMGANLGHAAGAGLPSHVHLHVLPRWSGDTNFMTTVAETRVMPETLATVLEEAHRRLARLARRQRSGAGERRTSRVGPPAPADGGRDDGLVHADRAPPRPTRRRGADDGSRPPAGPPCHAPGLADRARRHRLRPGRPRGVGPLVEGLRALGVRQRLQDAQLVVGAAGLRRRDPLLRLLRRHAVRALQGGPPDPALDRRWSSCPSASQALTNSLPVGNAVATVYGFRWFRRFGADNTLAVWALAGTLVASMVSLSLVAVIGLGLATNEGASLDLVPVLIGVFAFALALGSLFVYERPLHAVVIDALRVSVAVTGRPRGDTTEQIASIMAWMTAVRLQLDADRPHRRVGHPQLAARLRLLRHDVPGHPRPHPVEGPAAGLRRRPAGRHLAHHARAASGWSRAASRSRSSRSAGAETSTAYAVLLYRIISFWFILVIGWLVHRPDGPAGAPGPLATPGHVDRHRGGASRLRTGARRCVTGASHTDARGRASAHQDRSGPVGRRGINDGGSHLKASRARPRAPPAPHRGRRGRQPAPGGHAADGLLGRPHRPRHDGRVVLPGPAHRGEVSG